MKRITKNLYKKEIPKKILEQFTSNEKVKWVLKDRLDIYTFLNLYCFGYITFEFIPPFLKYDYQFLSGALNFDKSIYAFVLENIIAFLCVWGFVWILEYIIFTKIIITTKKLYIYRFFKVTAIEKSNIDPKGTILNLFIPNFTIVKTIDGRHYWFPSVSLTHELISGLRENDIVKREKLRTEIKENLEQQKEKDGRRLLSLNGKIFSVPIIGKLLVILLFITPIIVLSYFVNLYEYNFHDACLPAKALKHNVMYKSLKILDSINFQDSKMAVSLRNNLFEHYYIMYDSFDDKKYNAIASFYHVLDEFQYYEKKQQENYKKIKEKDIVIENYTTHEAKIIDEISNILKEYSYRNEYYYADISGLKGWKTSFLDEFRYLIPNRLTFYPYLANFYIQHTADLNNIEEQKYILSAYDEVFEQEKNIDSVMYERFEDKRPAYDYMLNMFWSEYSGRILQNELVNNKGNFCTNCDVINKLFISYMNSDRYGDLMNEIISRCSYEVELGLIDLKNYKKHVKEE